MRTQPVDSVAGLQLTKNRIVLYGILLLSFITLYRNVIAKLIQDWSIDENYSHGYLVLPVAIYFVWERRKQLSELPLRPSWLGLPVVLASIGLLLAGILGAEVFTTEVSMLGVIAGVVLYLGGWQHMKTLLFPILFLISMIPLPAIIFNQITFPLQILASRFGETILMTLQIPVLREGNVIQLANTTLEVAEACSGIRSLITLMSLGIVCAYFMDHRTWFRTVLAMTTIPVAIVANGLRVAGTGVAASFYGPSVATGFLHTFSGWLIFITAFIMLLFVHRVLVWRFPRHTKPIEPPLERLAAYSSKP